MITKPIGIYVHIPFCLKKCNYCDFCSFKVDELSWQDEYIDCLCREINSYKEQGITIDSIFFGGGTPSLLNSDQFKRIVNTINSTFTVLPDTEFTIEANPKTLNREKLIDFISYGVNRVSIGLQSIHENEMKILGRIHSYDDFLTSYNLVRKCGINNVNIDLMYGIPEQTINSFALTLDTILDLSPEHISLYGLIVEDGTPFGKNPSSLNLPSEDVECDMYELACSKLAKHGYTHYEISNYAKDGMSCKHNLKYWHNEEYIGVGLAAYSYFKGKRYGNSEDVNDYLSGYFGFLEDAHNNSPSEEAYEYVMLALRLVEGFSLEEYHNRFSLSFIEGRESLIDSFVKADLMQLHGDRISLTEKGFYVSNSILTELL